MARWHEKDIKDIKVTFINKPPSSEKIWYALCEAYCWQNGLEFHKEDITFEPIVKKINKN